MDKFEKLASTADFCVALLGNPQTSDYEIVDISSAAPKVTPEAVRQKQERGLYFLGVAGFVQGVPQTALEDGCSIDAAKALAEAYTRHVEAALRENIEVLSLMHLHGLPDTRTLN